MASFDALAEAYVRLRAKDDGTLSRDVQSIVGRVATDAASLFAGKKLLDVGIAGLDELEHAQVVTAQTAVQLKATGEAAGVSAQHIDDLGQSMLDLAGFDDEAARSAANVLLQFNQIKGTAAFDRVEKDAGDLAVTLGEDLPSAARTLGLALQDPERGVRLLRAANITLTDSQKNQLAAAVAANDAAKEQDIILGIVEARVHGAAAAYGETLTGALQRSKEEMKNAKAELVSGFAPAINLGATVVTGLAHGIEDLPPALQVTIGGLALAGGGVISLIRPLGDLARLFEAIQLRRAASAATTVTDTTAETENAAAKVVNAAATGTAAAATGELASAETAAGAAAAEEATEIAALAEFEAAYAGTTAEAAAATESQELASAGMLATLGPLGLALGVAAAGLTLFALNSGDSEKSAQALDSAVQKLDTDLASLSSGQGPKELTSDIKAFLDQLVAAGSGGDKYRDALNAVGVSTGQFADILGKGSQAAGEFITSLLFHGADKDMVRVLGELVEKTAQHAQTTLLADVAQGRLTQSQVDNAAATHLNAAGTTDWIATLNSLQGAIAVAAAATDGMTASQGDQLTSTRNLFDAQQAVTTAQHGIEQASRGVSEAERGVSNANQQLKDSYLSVADAQQKVIDAQKALDKALDPALAAEDRGKATLDLSDAQQRQADALTAVADAQHKLDRDTALGRTRSLAKDQADLTKAQNDLQRATFGVTDAQRAYDEAQKRGTDQDPAVIQGRKDLADANRGLEDANLRVADAVQSVADAQQRVLDAKDAVNEAYVNEATAAANLRDAQDKLYGANESVSTSLRNQIIALQEVDAQLEPGSPARQHLDDYIAHLFVLAGIFDPSVTAFGGAYNPDRDNPSRNIPGHAAGGRLNANELSWVGENGPELWQPDTAGTIIPLRAYRGDEPRGGDTYNYSYVINNPAPEPASGTIRRELARQSVLNGG